MVVYTLSVSHKTVSGIKPASICTINLSCLLFGFASFPFVFVALTNKNVSIIHMNIGFGPFPEGKKFQLCVNIWVTFYTFQNIPPSFKTNISFFCFVFCKQTHSHWLTPWMLIYIPQAKACISAPEIVCFQLCTACFKSFIQLFIQIRTEN